MAWRLFCLFASRDHASVVWQTYRSTRKANCTSWTFEDGSTESSFQ